MTSRYPEQASLRDGRSVLIRPYRAGDAETLTTFLRSLPDDVRRFAWDRIDRPNMVELWEQSVDYDRVFPLLAFDGGRIVADATLTRRDGGPLRLVGQIKWLLAPDFRGAGLGVTLVNLLIDTARSHGLRHLSCMLISDLEAEAVKVLMDLGFTPFEVPNYGADPDGGSHDMTMLVYSF